MRLVLAVVIVLAGCGGGRTDPSSAAPNDNPEPSGEAVRDDTSASTELTEPVTLLAPPADIAEVRARTSAIVLLEGRARPDGAEGACFVAAGVAWSRDFAFRPDACVPVVGFGHIHPGVRIWALLGAEHGDTGTSLRHLGNVRVCQPSADCPAPSDDEIFRAARCAHQDAIWTRVPGAHQSCGADADCAVVSAAANCLNLPLHRDAAPAYAAYRDTHDVPCNYAAMGMCAGPSPTAFCQDGVCALAGGGLSP